MFILLTFFFALCSVVLITFIFLRTQLNENKLQSLVAEAIQRNLPEYNVSFSKISLNLGTKFRYKIDRIIITHQTDKPYVEKIVLKNLSIKFPLFFLLGKQDIEVSVESMKVHGANFAHMKQNNYLLIDSINRDFVVPRIISENRINFQVELIDFVDSTSKPPMPFEIGSLRHFILKDISFAGKTAIESSFSIKSLDAAGAQPLELEVVSIGHFSFGQFFKSVTATDYKLLLEVKNVSNPDYGWLINHRMELTPRQGVVQWHLVGSAVEAKGSAAMGPVSMTLRDLDVNVFSAEISRENSTLKNIFYILSETLDAPSVLTSTMTWKGELTYYSNLAQWVVHLSSDWSSVEGKRITVETDTLTNVTTEIMYSMKFGSDLSYRKVNLFCDSLFCTKENLLRVEIDYYKPLLSTVEQKNMDELYTYVSHWWGSFAQLISQTRSTPLRIVWRKARWRDFDFDMIAKLSSNRNILAADEISIKQGTNERSNLKFSLNRTDSGMQWLVYTKLAQFPAALLTQLFSINKLELSGEVFGKVALEIGPNEKKVTSDLIFKNGSVQWLNFDNLFRQKLYKQAEDELQYPGLNWSGEFETAKALIQWGASEKEVQLEIEHPKLARKNIFIRALNSENEYQAKISYPGLQTSLRKFMMRHFKSNDFSFQFSSQPNELKRIQPAAGAL